MIESLQIHPRSWLAFSLLALALLCGSPAHAIDAEKPFAVVALDGPLVVEQGGEGDLKLRYQVFKDHFIYRDMSSVRVVDAAGLEVSEATFPKGDRKFDRISDKEREIYATSFDVLLQLRSPRALQPGVHQLRLEARWQGCNAPKNYCLFPARQELIIPIRVAPAQTAPRGGPPALTTPPVPAVSFADLESASTYQEIDDEGKEHPVKARLFAEQGSFDPGSSFRLAVHLEQKEGWHTYWKSPGDIGLPTRIDWSLPAGWTAEAFEFPVPLRFDQEGIVSYGYDDQVMFFSEVSIPPDQEPGLVELSAEVNWLVCETSCIPGKAYLKHRINVVSDPPGQPLPGPRSPLFQHFSKQHPVAALDVSKLAFEALLSVSAVRPEQPFQAAVRVVPAAGVQLEAPQSVATWPAFTPISSLNGFVSEYSLTNQDDGSLLVKMEAEAFPLEEGEELPAGQLLGGLFQLLVDGEWVRTEVTVPVPWARQGEQVARSDSGLFAAKGSEQESADEVVAAGVSGDAPQSPGGHDGSAPISAAVPTPTPAEGGLLWMLLLAFVGGMLLNIMPCVLPVLTMKLYSLVEQRDISASERRTAGISYSAGIVASFLLLALAVVVLRVSFDQQVLWGFQFQYPAYVAGLAAIVWLFGLSLFGVFEVPALGANRAAEASAQEGASGYFLTGVFATLLATPCSAPFLGTGMGFAFSLPTAGVVLFFAVAGLGLAAPFLAIAMVPALYRFLPRPGAWMDAFKQLMGFTLVATTLWLVDVLMAQIGSERGIGFLAVLLVLSMSAWVFGRWGAPTRSIQSQLLALAAALLIAAVGAWAFLDLEMAEEPGVQGAEVAVDDLDFSEAIPWLPFAEQRLDELAGRTVFVDFTADWCLTCKVNERSILETARVRSAMDELGVVPMKADWTRKDPVITRWLKRYGKAGVPFYLVIPADRAQQTIPLPEVITADGVIEALRRG